MLGERTGSIERGRASIGALIVFLAMILLAAVLAGVLITAAGELGSQGAATGEETGMATGEETGMATGEVSPVQLAESIQGVTVDAAVTADAELTAVAGAGTEIGTTATL